jgi:phage-related protein
MGKDLSTNLQTSSEAEENNFRMLITIFLDDQTIYLCANDTGNITFPASGGNIYEAVNIDRSEVQTTMSGQATEERVTLTLSDVDASIASYVAVYGNKVHNRRCLIQEIDIDYLDDPNDIVTIFDGVMDKLRFKIGTYQVDVVRQLGTYAQQIPFINYSPTCQWKKFKDEKCGYTGSGITCDRTLTQCQAYNNVLNFGGHPSIPDEMTIRTG